MSKADPASAKMAVRTWPILLRTANHLVATATNAVVSTIVQRAAAQASRELAALDDRTLADVGLNRVALTSRLDVLAQKRTAAVLAQFPWDGQRVGA